jgi:uncharacterized tellurite resistance protein B-like protein
MTTVLVVSLTLVGLTLVALGILYLRFRNSPAAVWQRRVRAAVEKEEQRLRAAQRELEVATDAAGARTLREEYLTRYLRGIAVEAVAEYPGIGPVTVGRLRGAGLSTVADCARVRLSNISGIGASRQADLTDALRKIRGDAEARFDAGACSEAREYAQELSRRAAGRERQIAEAQQRVREAESALEFLADRARVAGHVTFLGHLFGHQPAGLSAELMQQTLSQQPQPIEPRPAFPAKVEPALAPEVSEQRKRPETLSTPSAAPPSPIPAPRAEPTPLDRLRAAAGFGLAVAKADGRIAVAERRQVQAFLKRRYAPTSELSEQIDAILAQTEADPPTLGDALWEVRRALPAESWPDLYQFAESVTDASGERNTREIECLERIAEELGVSGVPEPISHPAAPPVETASASATEPLGKSDEPPSELECRAALEIEPGMPLSVDLVRRQYRLLIERYAAAKFANHAPEFVQMAADKRARVERAARHLCAEYNEPLDPPDATPAPADLRHNPDLDAVFGG